MQVKVGLQEASNFIRNHNVIGETVGGCNMGYSKL